MSSEISNTKRRRISAEMFIRIHRLLMKAFHKWKLWYDLPLGRKSKHLLSLKLNILRKSASHKIWIILYIDLTKISRKIKKYDKVWGDKVLSMTV